jgi:2-oxoglutarate ferredoxin oxidoreductase subunit beta
VHVRQHDGSLLRLRKLENEHHPTDRIAAIAYLQRHEAQGEVVTGLLFIDPRAGDLHEHIGSVETPLNRLGAGELCPGPATLAKINASLR